MEKNKQKFKLKLKERREKAKEEAKEDVIDVTVADNEFEGEEKNMTPPPSPPKNAYGSPMKSHFEIVIILYFLIAWANLSDFCTIVFVVKNTSF